MSAISVAAKAIAAAAGTVQGVRVYTDPGANVQAPAVVVGPPRLYWDVLTVQPSRAVFEVLVVAQSSDRTMPQLWELVPAVAAAISDSGVGDVDDNGASPSVFTAGGASLPAYSISITAPIGG